ncbi:Hypothetical predicted protein [Lecanosticta acicola]|uniref:DUF7726 domain-containing protein n=1 Tax=Lecanosticta acicola TaxID=111012 RepID=A0AAI8YWA8_9PEZI|nr:Hypothetical predicted protein [Lecanosticta acicola]
MPSRPLRSAIRSPLEDVTGRANNQPTPPPTIGAKRKANDAPASDINLDDIDVGVTYVDASCDQVRRKIRRFLDSGELNKGQFATAIGVSGKSLNDFLSQVGSMNGSGSATYAGAWEFFKKREIAGLKMPPVKRAKQSSASPALDISGILLTGEAFDNVPIYESCDEVRKKINAHLAKPGVTQAQFCRDLAAQYHSETKKIQSKQLVGFRSKKGPWAGNTSIVCYTAYVYFEKLRLAEGRPKSEHRQGMEAVHPAGLDTQRTHERVWCKSNKRPVVDQFGRFSHR